MTYCKRFVNSWYDNQCIANRFACNVYGSLWGIQSVSITIILFFALMLNIALLDLIFISFY